jgi:hypothetical protein
MSFSPTLDETQRRVYNPVKIKKGTKKMATYATGNPEMNKVLNRSQKISDAFFRGEIAKVEKILRNGLEKYGIIGKALEAVCSHIIPDAFDPDWMDLNDVIESGKICFSTSEKEQAVRRANAWYWSEFERLVFESDTLEGNFIENEYEKKGWL